ncbi:MAG: Sec-independent protein translocase protein TatB [Gammaproteobacteria bacterium]
MFDIGFWEIFLIGILALLVIGPERLPGAARSAGYWVGRARRYIEGVKNDVESEFDMSEFKRLLHNQEVQITELQQKLNSKVDDEELSTMTDDFMPEYDFQDDPPPERNEAIDNDARDEVDVEIDVEPDAEVEVDAAAPVKEKQDKPPA